MCQTFSTGLRECAYQQKTWPKVHYDTQTQHCVALLNIVAQKLETMETQLEGFDTAFTSDNNTEAHSGGTTVKPNITSSDSMYTLKVPITNWVDFGIGYGFGITGYLILMFLKWAIMEVCTILHRNCCRIVNQVQAPAPFAFVRGVPARLPEGLPPRANGGRSRSNRNNQVLPAEV